MTIVHHNRYEKNRKTKRMIDTVLHKVLQIKTVTKKNGSVHVANPTSKDGTKRHDIVHVVEILHHSNAVSR